MMICLILIWKFQLKTIIETFKHITDTNVATLVISLIAIIFLVVFKYLNDKFAKKLPVPFPSEVLVVSVEFIILHDKFRVNNLRNKGDRVSHDFLFCRFQHQMECEDCRTYETRLSGAQTTAAKHFFARDRRRHQNSHHIICLANIHLQTTRQKAQIWHWCQSSKLSNKHCRINQLVFKCFNS